MKIILTGSTGQLGNEILSQAPNNINIICPNRNELNLLNPKLCKKYIIDSKPDLVINAGAYTDVEGSEEKQEIAYTVNCLAPKSIAEGLKIVHGSMIQISTDYVFDGEQNIPYKINDLTNPLNFYGKSKADSEKEIMSILPNKDQLYILRTSWLIGNKRSNFALKFLKMHEERNEIFVIADQIGCPTSTSYLAMACWKLINQKFISDTIMPTFFHFSNSGVSSWYDLAVSVGEIGLDLGLIKKRANVIPIKSNQYKTKVKRPKYSILDCNESLSLIGLKNIHWREALVSTLKSMI